MKPYGEAPSLPYLTPPKISRTCPSGRALAFSFPSLMPTHQSPEKGSASRSGLGEQGRSGETDLGSAKGISELLRLTLCASQQLIQPCPGPALLQMSFANKPGRKASPMQALHNCTQVQQSVAGLNLCLSIWSTVLRESPRLGAGHTCLPTPCSKDFTKSPLYTT